MKKFLIVWCVAAFLMHGVAMAASTGTVGNGQPVSRMQPSLAISSAVLCEGLFPVQGGGSAAGATIGFVYNFAGNYAPVSSFLAQGQLLPVGDYDAAFNVLGTAYGGDGATNFALPDLGGRAIMGAGAGLGLSVRMLGDATGNDAITLALAQMPAHSHALPGGGVTKPAGGVQAISNVQPSLPLRRLIAVTGVYPSQGGSSGSATFLGQVATFAGDFVPGGWMEADGSLLPIASNAALFSLLGVRYGGNGMTTFALPDLRGRVSVGADATHPLGSVFGAETTVLAAGQLPTHSHGLPGGGSTGAAGQGQAVDTAQPSLALNYIISLYGVYASPSAGGFSPDVPVVGQIAEFAGNYAPSGWAIADGSLLSIQQNTALFSILGTQYGGNGITTFALPDLRGRTLIGTSPTTTVGAKLGADQAALTVDNLPAHNHSYTPVATPTPGVKYLLDSGQSQ